MSSSVTGRFTLDSGDLSSLTSLRLIVTDEKSLFREPLNSAAASQSDAARADHVQTDGTFSVAVDGGVVNQSTTSPRTLTLTVYTSCFRKLYSQAVAENSSGTTDFGSIALWKAEVSGYTVTLGNATPLQNMPVREHNAVRPLIDGEDAWSYLCDKMNAATKSVYVMQLAFDTPVTTGSSPGDEAPEIVLKFQTPYDATTLSAPTIADPARPEQILIDLKNKGVDVRVVMTGTGYSKTAGVVVVLLPAIGLIATGHDEIAGIYLLLIMFGVLLATSVYVDTAESIIIGFSSGSTGIEHYLQAYKSNVDFQRFPLTLGQWVHSKMVIVDDTEAIALGSPFHQSYWDTHDHYIYEPRRGSASDEPIPVHDISMAVRGPAVADMSDAYRLHYNVANPSNKVGPNTTPSEISTPNRGEYLAALQMVRTLNAKLFDNLVGDKDHPRPYAKSTGEQGILEAYLRAFENAADYIYLENQYFVNKTIAKALVAALNDTNPARSNLQIIVLLNVTPDAPLYSLWQWRRIQQIRKDAGKNASRIGFFTTWSHNAPITNAAHNIKQSKPMISANYLHSKFGMVDGKWLTVGSCNLDGLSLETSDYLGFLPGQDRRDHEINLCILNGVDGASSTDAIRAFRQNLWAEHLGYVNDDGSLKPDDPDLADNAWAGNGGWLGLFQRVAEAKAQGLVANPATIDKTLGRVLEFPANTFGRFHLFPETRKGRSERDVLEKLNISLAKLDLIPKVHPYNFRTDHWS